MDVGTTQVFTDEAVPNEDLMTIMRAGLAAPSAINQQPWFFVAVTDREIMDEIAGSGMSFAPPAGAPQNDGKGPSDGPAAMPALAASGAKAGMGDSPAAVIIYRNDSTKSPNADFDCGLAAQNMVIAAASLGYGVKIVSSPTMALNGDNHDALCDKLGVDRSMQAVAVILIGKADSSVDGFSGASARDELDAKTAIIG